MLWELSQMLKIKPALYTYFIDARIELLTLERLGSHAEFFKWHELAYDWHKICLAIGKGE